MFQLINHSSHSCCSKIYQLGKLLLDKNENTGGMTCVSVVVITYQTLSTLHISAESVKCFLQCIFINTACTLAGVFHPPALMADLHFFTFGQVDLK